MVRCKRAASRNLPCLIPDEAAQQAVMKTIYDIKAGCDTDTAKQTFTPAINWAQSQGAEAVIAGCTELSLILTGDTYQGLKVVDAMKVVAYKVLERVLAKPVA